jgi:hypothetical protein
MGGKAPVRTLGAAIGIVTTAPTLDELARDPTRAAELPKGTLVGLLMCRSR